MVVLDTHHIHAKRKQTGVVDESGGIGCESSDGGLGMTRLCVVEERRLHDILIDFFIRVRLRDETGRQRMRCQCCNRNRRHYKPSSALDMPLLEKKENGVVWCGPHTADAQRERERERIYFLLSSLITCGVKSGWMY